MRCSCCSSWSEAVGSHLSEARITSSSEPRSEPNTSSSRSAIAVRVGGTGERTHGRGREKKLCISRKKWERISVNMVRRLADAKWIEFICIALQ